MVASKDDYDPSTALCTSDISVDNRENPSMVCVVLRQSKTDPCRKAYTWAEHMQICAQSQPF